MTKQRAKGNSASKISNITGIPQRRIEHWIFEGNLPFAVRMLSYYLHLQEMWGNEKLLSLNSTRGGLFTGPWINVPNQVKNYLDVKKVIEQLAELPSFLISKERFRLNKTTKEELFAYFLGFLIGDASKTGIKRKQRMTRRVHVRLSKNYPTNKLLGDFVTLCANAFGLRMNQRKDCPAGKLNPHPFYTWISQSSLLVQWIFNVCLGLDNNMKTTYDPISAEWILNSPDSFKIRFIQGLADSDGFVDFSARQAGILTGPNTSFVQKVFTSLRTKTTRRYFAGSKLWALMINIHDAHNLPIFNEFVNSYRYCEMEKMSKAKRHRRWPQEFKEKIENYIKEGYFGTKLIRKILDEENVLISTKKINKIRKEWQK